MQTNMHSCYSKLSSKFLVWPIDPNLSPLPALIRRNGFCDCKDKTWLAPRPPIITNRSRVWKFSPCVNTTGSRDLSEPSFFFTTHFWGWECFALGDQHPPIASNPFESPQIPRNFFRELYMRLSQILSNTLKSPQISKKVFPRGKRWGSPKSSQIPSNPKRRLAKRATKQLVTHG